MFSYLNPFPQLPKYKGPHKVGSTEFEIPVSELEAASAAPDPRITTIKFRVFYPTTSSAKSKRSIPWLPTPQKQWNQAYAQFVGISEKRANLLSNLPSLLNHATIPAVQNAPLAAESEDKTYPVVIFSHGLGGNCNIYSSIVGSLASCGIICVTPEHRDGSAPMSIIKSSKEEVQTKIGYEPVAHSPTVEVLNKRNAMLRIRLWELGLLYTAINQINQGVQFSNFADTVSSDSTVPNFKNVFNLRPGQVTWAGHSFGAATTLQFIKCVYYRQQSDLAQRDSSDTEGWDLSPLYVPKANSELVRQIIAESPVAFFDLWTMPLRGETTRWLWEKPLPCYDRKSTHTSPNVVAIMSTEFYKWTDLRNRTRAALSSDPNAKIDACQREESGDHKSHTTETVSSEISSEFTNQLPSSKQPRTTPVEKDLHEPAEPLPTTTTTSAASSTESPDSLSISSTSTPLTRTSSPELVHNNSTASSQSSLVDSTVQPSKSASPSPSPSSGHPAHLYLVHNTVHLSQSDFGLLFPNLTRYLLKALDPEKTIELNVRAVLAMMRGCGLAVDDLRADVGITTEEEDPDPILGQHNGKSVDARWERIKL